MPTGSQQDTHKPDPEVIGWRVQGFRFLRRAVAKAENSVQHTEDGPTQEPKKEV